MWQSLLAGATSRNWKKMPQTTASDVTLGIFTVSSLLGASEATIVRVPGEDGLELHVIEVPVADKLAARQLHNS